MGERNLVMNHLLEKPPIFADFMNGTAFGGRQVLKPENLRLESGREGILYVDKDGMKRVLEKERDVCMKAQGPGMQFAVLACENQSRVHYAMPVRNMLYDALSYMGQVRDLEKQHKERGEKLTGDEFLSGISKEDRLIPVVTTVLYLGDEEWDGSKSLYEMLGLEKENEMADMLREYLPDYRLNIVHASHIENIEVFQTGLQQLFGMLKYNSNKTELYQYVKENREEIRRMDEDILAAAITLLGGQKKLDELLREQDERGEEKDMCKALEELYEDGVKCGEERGLERGIKQGIEQGIRALIETCRELGVTREITWAKINTKFTLKEGAAEKYLEKYWPA